MSPTPQQRRAARHLLDSDQGTPATRRGPSGGRKKPISREAIVDAAFAIVDEELELGLRSIAVPISDRTGHIVAAINVSTQSARFSVDAMEREILPALRKAKLRIEEFFFV